MDTWDKATMLTLSVQVLGITCDNASPNNVMINKLLDFLCSFSGASSHMQCFNHVVVLVTMRVVCQFDVPMGSNDKDSETEQELQDLVEGLDIEDAVTQKEHKVDDEEIEEWADKRGRLSATDHKEHSESIRAIQMLLVKVSSLLCSVQGPRYSPAWVASENLVCNNPLQYKLAAVVVFHTQEAET